MSESAALRVTTRLRARIVEAQIDAGTPLREVALAKEFGVSRVPVREALQILTTEGFVVSRPNVGSRVAAPPYADAAELFDLRIVLEVAMARSAAERFQHSATASEETAALRAEVEAALSAGEQAVAERDARLVAEANQRYHRCMAELSLRPVLADLLQQIGGRIEWMHAAHGRYTANRGSGAWDQHRRIYELVAAGEPDAAAAAMEEHLISSRDAFLAGIAELPDPAGS